jgi:hypothetical protein
LLLPFHFLSLPFPIFPSPLLPLPMRFACLSHLILISSCLLLVLLVKFGLWSENPHTVTVVTCLRDRKEKNGIEKNDASEARVKKRAEHEDKKSAYL